MTTTMTEAQIATEKARIDAMTQEDMARLWRFAAPGHPYFDRRLPLYEYFEVRFKGFTPQLSKQIGLKEQA